MRNGDLSPLWPAADRTVTRYFADIGEPITAHIRSIHTKNRISRAHLLVYSAGLWPPVRLNPTTINDDFEFSATELRKRQKFT